MKIATVGFLKTWASHDPNGNFSVTRHKGRLLFDASKLPRTKSLLDRITDSELDDSAVVLVGGHLLSEGEFLVMFGDPTQRKPEGIL